MTARRQFLATAAMLAISAGLAAPVAAQGTIKIGELNSYKVFPAFLEPWTRVESCHCHHRYSAKEDHHIDTSRSIVGMPR